MGSPGHPVGELLEPLLVVDRHREDVPRLRELRLQVAYVAEAEGPLGLDAVLRLPQRRAQRVRATIRIGVTAAVTAIEPSWLLAT
jgi:hypothetical protein